MVYEATDRLGNFFISRRERGIADLPTLSVTLTNGLVLRDSLDRKMETNLSDEEHLLVRKDDIVYNTMRMWQGASGLADRDGLLSPAYVVLASKKGVDSLYASYLFKSSRLIYLFWAYSYGLTSDRLRLYFNDFKSIPVNIPPLPEQKNIGEILSTWDKAIGKLEALIAAKQKRKKALMQQLLTGKMRVPGFDGTWKFANFDDLFIIVNDKKTQVKSSDYLESGSTPIIDQGQKAIAGFTNNEVVYIDVPVIIFGDHTRIIKWVDFSFAPGADGTQVLKTKKPIDLKLGFFLLSHIELPNLGYSRHMKELKEKEFKFPVNNQEQQKIATVLSAADNEIITHKTQLAALKQQKTALMQQLLTGKKRVQINED